MIKNIFFDLDGTLIDSAGDITASVNTMRHNYNLEPVTKEIVANVIGKGYPNTVRKMLAINFDSEYIETIVDEAIQIVTSAYKEQNSANTIVYNGVRDTLEYYKQKNIMMAVVTNKTEDAAKDTLKHLCLDKYFD